MVTFFLKKGKQAKNATAEYTLPDLIVASFRVELIATKNFCALTEL
jgi:hypothetical protein